jgi:mono/diheme cytochrome c family protein
MNPSRSAAGITALTAAAAILSVLALSFDAPAQNPGDAQNGKKVFEKLGCSACHGTLGEGKPAAGKESGIPKIAATHLSLAEFVHSVRKPKGAMPAFEANQVSDTELADVYSFLQSVGAQRALELPASANPQNGRRFYAAFGCYECHGLQGQGSVQTGGARLGPPAGPFSGFVVYVRQPTGQMPPYTAKVVSDQQLADIYSFLKTIPAPPPAKSIPLLNQ